MRRLLLPLLATTLPLLGADPAAGKPAAPPNPPAYALATSFAVGGEGGWDYLVADAATKRLYVPRSTRVAVLDLESGKPVGEIPKTEGVHGVALAHDLGRGFASNGRAGTVTIFALDTLKTIAEVKTTGENPDAIVYEPSTKRVFSLNGRGKSATAIDAATGTVAGTIPLGGKPEFAVADGSGHVFVNIEDTSEVVTFDAKALTVTARWKVAGCEEPTGLALDRKASRLLVACSNKLAAIVSAADGKLVATVPTGAGSDGAAWDTEAGLGFVSNGEGTLTVIRQSPPGTYASLSVPTKHGARTVALDEKSHRLYLPTASFGPPPSPTADRPHPRPAVLPGTFEILVVAPKS